MEFVLLLMFLSITETGATPICNESYGYVEVEESTAVGTVIKEIRCTRGTSDPLNYAIKSGNMYGKFGVNTTNDVGKVYVYQTISFESRTISFQLTIEISENGPFRSSVIYVLDIQITGVNDYAPLFLFSPYSVYVNENMRPGSIISTPIPYDFDKGDDGTTTSVILDGDDELFYMDPRTARVYLRSYLDYERKTDYALVIQVTDNGRPLRRSSTTILNVHVKDVNDNPPVCEEPYITETFDEMKAPGTVIKYIKCTDADPGNNGRLSYTITQGDYTKFRLQGPYLVLSRAIDVDREPNVWSISVVVSDRGEPKLSALVDIIIFVEGVDDNAPKWSPPQNGNYVINLEENSNVGTLVTRTSAEDLDKDVVIYYIDDYNSVFAIKPTTGDIFLTQVIDREKRAMYTLSVSAVSHNNPVDKISTNVIVNVIDVNDNTPTFDKDIRQFFLSESASVKSLVAIVTATDLDTGANADVYYKIIGGNQDSLFDIEPRAGEISLSGKLDYETVATHIVFLQASDRGRPSRSSTCTVIVSVLPVNEFEPMFKETETVFIPEDTSIGSSVFKISATDGDAGLDGAIIYKLEPAEDRFTVESRTGIVRLLKTLDRESEQQLKVQVIATDMSETTRKSGTITVYVNVVDRNDNPPICEKSFIAIKMVAPTSSGAIIQKLTCTDADDAANSKLTFNLISGNANSDFAMSTDGSLIIMRRPTLPEYRLEIRVSDNGSPQLDTLVLILVQVGGAPVVNNLPDTVLVPENVTIGSPIFEVRVQSVSQQLEYRITNITSGNGVISDDPPLIRIDKTSGKIFTWNNLDREKDDKWFVTVEVTETISGIQTKSRLDLIVTDVNDNVPRFERSLYNISVIENIPIQTEVIRVKATDRDVLQNAELDYDIVKGNNDNSFTIDKSGMISIRGNVDREKFERFNLVVTASDRGQDLRHTGTTTVMITVLDDDEYDPEFINAGSNLETSLPEDTPLAAKVFAMEARDLDIHGKLLYGLDNMSQSHFIIDRNTGDIFLARYLDREAIDLHTLVVTVDGQEKRITGTITLAITDVNDNEPVFNTNIYHFTVNETSKPGSLVGAIYVSDIDLGENAIVTVSIVKGNIGNAFYLKQNKLYVNGNLDYDDINEYILELEARDGGFPQMTSLASVMIQILPEYRIPKFPTDLEVVHVPENVHLGYSVYDADGTLKGAREGHGKDLMYSIESGNNDGIFSIERETGKVTVSRRLDTDTGKSVFMLLLVARNIYSQSHWDKMTLRIEKDDINDHTPVFESEWYIFSIKENLKTASSIATLSATDLDREQNAIVKYKLVPSDDSETFSIDPFTGTLSLQRQLNYMYSTGYQLLVSAVDQGSPQLTGTTYVQINVIDVNDKPPTFEEVSSVIRVSENYAVGRNIYQIKARDDDTGVGGEIFYRIVSGNENETFELDSESGELTVAKLLDRESIATHRLVIEAEDKGTPSLTGTATVTVIVTDINDNAPFFSQKSYTVSLDRFSAMESYVLSVTAHDADEGNNALIEYQISEEHEVFFQIDSNSGRIFTFTDLSTVANDLQITVIAKDRGIPRLSASAMVLIDIHPPLFVEKVDFTFTVSEFSAPNTFVGAVGSSQSLRYEITSGNYKRHFRISEDEGNIFLTNVLDRESYSDYFIGVRSTYKMSENIRTDLNVHIQVIDENDNAPKFEKAVYSLIVLEHSPIGFSVATITASDADIGNNRKISYSIVNGGGADARNIFTINGNGTIIVKSPIIFDMVDHVNFSVVAQDNGVFSRTASAQIYVRIVNIDENIVSAKAVNQAIAEFEMPTATEEGYIVGCLSPLLFGLNITSANVQYITQSYQEAFYLAKETGCISTRQSDYFEEGECFLLWVVAVVTVSGKGWGNLGLVRIDTFSPNKHIAVLTHSVSLEVLEINRELLLQRLQSLFPNNYPRIWKTEAFMTTARRRLLFTQSSQSYIYVIQDNSTTSLTGVLTRKRFVLQEDILKVLVGPDYGVSQELTSEEFDTFPVASVEKYSIADKQEQVWTRTTAGKWILGATITVGVVAIIILTCLLHRKLKKKSKCSKLQAAKPSLCVPPNTNQVDPKYNNLRRSSSTADLIPLMNALKVLCGMDEKERNKLVELTLSANKTHAAKENNNVKTTAKFLNKMRTLPLINVSHIDEVRHTRKISNEAAEEDIKTRAKQKSPVVSAPIHPFESTPDLEQSTDSGDKDSELCVITTVAPMAPSSSCNDNESVSSIELDTAEPVANTGSQQTLTDTFGPFSLSKGNRPIIIGGKEYDGVGKDEKSGGRYLYNTQTGDKIHVTDDILKRAIEQRESVMKRDFNEDERNAKFSTFKRPAVKRKTSRTRFSTTTIWEMNVDHTPTNSASEDVDNVFYSMDESAKKELETKTGSTRKRRKGVDYSMEELKRPSTLQKIRKEAIGTTQNKKDSVESISLDNSPKKDTNDPDKANAKPEHKDQIRRISIKKRRDKNGSGSRSYMDNSSEGEMEISDSATKEVTNNNDPGNDVMTQKSTGFVRPMYKPLNLDNVTCKVPKGKSEPKDCLSKDPFYAGWAKIVGRRVRTKMMKKKDEPPKTVTVREGRSLPINISASSLLNKNLYKPDKLMTIDV